MLHYRGGSSASVFADCLIIKKSSPTSFHKAIDATPSVSFSLSLSFCLSNIHILTESPLEASESHLALQREAQTLYYSTTRGGVLDVTFVHQEDNREWEMRCHFFVQVAFSWRCMGRGDTVQYSEDDAEVSFLGLKI